MSAEVAKKRGRPKKVITDPVEVELPETVKAATTRAKSTKTATAKTKAVPSASAKATVVKKSVSKTTGASATTKPAPKAAPAKVAAKVTEKVVAAKPTPTTPTTSKIIEQVKEMEAKKAATQEIAKEATGAAEKVKIDSEAKPLKEVEKSQQETGLKQSTETTRPQSTIAAKATPIVPQQKPVLASKPTDSKASAKPPPPPAKSTPPPPAAKSTPSPPPAKTSPTPPAAKPTPKPHVPISQLNSAIVSNITTRAGARPNTAGSQQLPKNYKPVARKVTMAIVALPIAIVTSYVLYQRLVLGEEKKMLVPPPKKLDVELKTEPSSSSQ